MQCGRPTVRVHGWLEYLAEDTSANAPGGKSEKVFHLAACVQSKVGISDARHNQNAPRQNRNAGRGAGRLLLLHEPAIQAVGARCCEQA
eukprot:1195963-Prorocentrum_minimum.AAC.4